MNQNDQQLNDKADDLAQQQTLADCGEQTVVADNSLCKKKWDKVLNVLLVLVILVLVGTILYKAFICTSVLVSGESMLPTYLDGQSVQVSRNANDSNVNRGDVVVFYRNHPGWFAQHFDFLGANDTTSQYYLLIKRVVALQGDKIWVEKINGNYHVKILTPQGEILSENNYLHQGETLPQENFVIQQQSLKRLENYTVANPYTVPQGFFFAMGDNRAVSHDSRYEDMGDIPYTNLFGKVM